MALIAWAPARARAQDEVSTGDRQAAAEAYDRGSAAYLSRNYEQAARYFETADRFAPSPAALTQAIRAHQRADNELRAANLALRLAGRYPEDRAAQRAASRVLSDAAGRLHRVDVRCDGCAVLLEGAVLDWPSFFVEPDTEQRVTAHFDTGDLRQSVRGPAGEVTELSFEAPPAPEPEAEPALPTPEPAPAIPPDRPVDDGGGLSGTWVFVTGALALVAGGVTIWSGLDTLGGVEAYEAEATTGDPARAQELLDEGERKELRTNVLIGVTAGLAAVTILLAALADWDGGGEAPPTVRAAVAVTPLGALGVIEGAF